MNKHEARGSRHKLRLGIGTAAGALACPGDLEKIGASCGVFRARHTQLQFHVTAHHAPRGIVGFNVERFELGFTVSSVRGCLLFAALACASLHLRQMT
jgi:hypothetical protein